MLIANTLRNEEKKKSKMVSKQNISNFFDTCVMLKNN